MRVIYKKILYKISENKIFFLYYTGRGQKKGPPENPSETRLYRIDRNGRKDGPDQISFLLKMSADKNEKSSGRKTKNIKRISSITR